MNPPNWLRAIGRVSLWVWAVLGLLFLFTPILVTVIFSFNEPTGKYNYIWNKFSLSGWTDPFRYPELTDALIFSLKIAVVVTAIATVLRRSGRSRSRTIGTRRKMKIVGRVSGRSITTNCCGR